MHVTLEFVMEKGKIVIHSGSQNRLGYTTVTNSEISVTSHN